ncbi:Membrane-bound transcription factor site-2 protease [Macleaya cordata]|uniref:Endopeptidase S2P n=1 Tax=Macleaya cordata TaxID=56857 RepID=A0A200QAL7_MACCD|nr:Membrane-bound transcription factor site-2 protease [Macleaya cordata]
MFSQVLLWNSASTLHLYNGNVGLSNGLLFGYLPSPSVLKVPGFSISVSNGGYIIFSTLISVAVHEFGHAISAARFSVYLRRNLIPGETGRGFSSDECGGGISYNGVASEEQAINATDCRSLTWWENMNGTTSLENSEGIQIEYIAIFLAVLFPGALVALNYEMLQSLPQFAVLRIYCAGIWHNAVCCAVCALALFVLPSVLYPFYIHGENPMVLDVTSMSPLSGYLSPGDVIVSIDGLQVHYPQEWMELMARMNEVAIQSSHHSKDSRSFQEAAGRKGYCISSSWIQDKKNIQLVDDQSTCPDELTVFSRVPCFNLNALEDGSTDDGNRKETRHCLSARDVVHHKKCGDGWLAAGSNRSSCECSQDETCMGPVLSPGVTWVEIAYSRPYSAECLWLWRNSSADFVSPDSGATDCGGTFVFIGDALSMANSIGLTAYRPRSAISLGLSLPNGLEKILACTFHVSLTLALLNSLPVFFLDGESILEVILVGYITLLSPRKRRQVLRIFLFGGTLLSIIGFFSIFL